MAERSNSNMLFANFNQDYSCISVGTRKGYSITNCDPFGRVYTKNDGPRGIVEMLFCTSLIALVGSSSPDSSSSTPSNSNSSPRKLQIVNTKRQSLICELLFPSSILSVKMNRKTLVIVLETEIYIYDISNMRLLHVIETAPNPDAVVALSTGSGTAGSGGGNSAEGWLCYPGMVPNPGISSSSPSSNAASSSNSSSTPSQPTQSTSQSGDVLIFSTRSLTLSNVIQAHKSPISFLSLSPSTSHPLLATASSKGTVIRVWSVPGAQKLYQFRRGTTETKIHSMAFNSMGSLLAVSSSHDTVHVFKLSTPYTGGGAASSSTSVDSEDTQTATAGGYEEFIEKKKGGGSVSSLRRKSMQVTKSIGGFLPLPNSVTELWEPLRAFAFLKLPTSGARCVVGISGTTPTIMIISSEGYFYSYSIDLEKGGECALLKQYSLLDGGEEE